MVPELRRDSTGTASDTQFPRADLRRMIRERVRQVVEVKAAPSVALRMSARRGGRRVVLERRALRLRREELALLDPPALGRLHIDVLVVTATDDAVRLAVLPDVEDQRIHLAGGAFGRRFDPRVRAVVAGVKVALPRPALQG